MIHAHKYVPYKTVATEERLPNADETVAEAESQLYRLLFGGDQLTVARANGAKKTRKNSTSPCKRLEGLIPCIEDWHAKVVLLEVCLSFFLHCCLSLISCLLALTIGNMEILLF